MKEESLIAGVNRRAYFIGLIGTISSIGLFFLTLFLRNYIHGLGYLIYPLILLTGIFFGGYWQNGTIKGGLLHVRFYLFLSGAVILLGLLLKYIQTNK